MNVKEILVLLAVLVFGYWLGSSGALASILPGG